MIFDGLQIGEECVGVAERSKLITAARVKAGDVLLGLPSSGVHSNGYSLVRKIVFEHKGFQGGEYMEELGKTIGEELLTPTRLYPRVCLPLIRDFDLHGMVHITGGGFYENIPRMLPEGKRAVIDKNSYEIAPVFRLLAETGNIDEKMMYNTYNMGIGMMLVTDPSDVDATMEAIRAAGDSPYVIGHIEDGKKGVTIC